MVNFINRVCGKIAIGFDWEKIPEIKCQIWGVILFERNFGAISEIKKLIHEITKQLGDVEILIDQEGGEKCRIKQYPYCLKSPYEMRNWSRTKVFDEFRRCGEALAELGITVNLAPVADLGRSEYIKRRTFGDNPEKVAEFVSSAVEGLKSGGVKCCLKHFPGLGMAHQDPHSELAIANDTSIDEHCLPFKAGINAGANFIMTTHIAIPQLGIECATYSSEIIKLARKINFTGKILTDDLATMIGANIENNSPQEKVLKALNSGHDVVLWCKNPEQLGIIKEN